VVCFVDSVDYPVDSVIQPSNNWGQVYIIYLFFLIFAVSGKYREFHKMYEEGKLQEAGHLLISLLTSKLAPQR